VGRVHHLNIWNLQDAYKLQDLLGKLFNSFATDPSIINDLIHKAASLTEYEMSSGNLNANTMIKHKYSEDVPVNMMVTMGGALLGGCTCQNTGGLLAVGLINNVRHCAFSQLIMSCVSLV
jgi:hypothetical protein